jgi:hypothetical protein
MATVCGTACCPATVHEATPSDTDAVTAGTPSAAAGVLPVLLQAPSTHTPPGSRSCTAAAAAAGPSLPVTGKHDSTVTLLAERSTQPTSSPCWFGGGWQLSSTPSVHMLQVAQSL